MEGIISSDTVIRNLLSFASFKSSEEGECQVKRILDMDIGNRDHSLMPVFFIDFDLNCFYTMCNMTIFIMHIVRFMEVADE